MFTLVKDPAHWWPVTFDVPADGGTAVTQTVELKLVRLGLDEYRELWSGPIAAAVAIRRGEQTPPSPDDNKMRDRQLFDRCVRGWRQIVDPEGSPLPFSEPWISQMIDVGNFLEGFGAAYISFWHAIPETTRGNSVPSPDGGQATVDAAPAAATKTTVPKSRRRSGNGGPAKQG